MVCVVHGKVVTGPADAVVPLRERDVLDGNAGQRCNGVVVGFARSAANRVEVKLVDRVQEREVEQRRQVAGCHRVAVRRSRMHGRANQIPHKVPRTRLVVQRRLHW